MAKTGIYRLDGQDKLAGFDPQELMESEPSNISRWYFLVCVFRK